MTTPTPVRDDIVVYSSAEIVSSPDRIGPMIEMLVEQCQHRGRDAAARESLGDDRPDYAAVFVGVDHAITVLPAAGFLVSVVVSTELRPSL
ncbi:hypothetical protein ACWEVD_01230 [Nocardia thailandica]